MNQKPNKIKLALIGERLSSPTLFTALQVAFGLCGKWEKIIVIGSSDNDGRYQHVGNYGTLFIPSDATPQRYMDLLNIIGACGTGDAHKKKSTWLLKTRRLIHRIEKFFFTP